MASNDAANAHPDNVAGAPDWLAPGAPLGPLFAPALDRAHALALAALAGLRERPVGVPPEAGSIAAVLGRPLPERGCAPEEAVAEWHRLAAPGITASPGPRFFGFVNGGSTPAALAGDWLAGALDQSRGLWIGSPAAAETETAVVGWLKELFELPRNWSGTLTSGATMANLVGLAAARQWVGQRLGFDPAADGLGGRAAIPIFSSTEIHASARKALGTLGLGRDAVHRLPAPDGALEVAALERALAATEGPAIVVANAGEVNTGAFDDLPAIAGRCAAHPAGAWLHVDAAFGLFARLAPSHLHLLDGIERADSVAADAHKWLNVPYDCGFALVRDEGIHRAAFQTQAAYLTRAPGAPRDLDHYVAEMSQRFRALSVWCALRAAGRAGYRAIVERCLANAAAFAAWVEDQAGLELLNGARLNIVCFRLVPADVPEAARDDLNRAAVAALQADGRVFVTGTVWQGKAAVRAAFDNWTTGPADVCILQDAVSEVAGRLSR